MSVGAIVTNIKTATYLDILTNCVYLPVIYAANYTDIVIVFV